MTAPKIPPGPFRHLDNILGIHRQTTEEVLTEAKTKKEKDDAMNAMAAEINVLQEFRRSESWTLIAGALTNETRVVRAALAECADAVTMAKGVGALLILEGFQTWPEDRVRELTEALEQLKTE
jgi:hypothetical protein